MITLYFQPLHILSFVHFILRYWWYYVYPCVRNQVLYHQTMTESGEKLDSTMTKSCGKIDQFRRDNTNIQ